MKNYEKLFENAEKPYVEARNWTDKKNEGEVPGNVLEKPSKPICKPMDEERLPKDGDGGLFV